MPDSNKFLTLVDDPFRNFDPDRVLHAANFAKCCHHKQKRSSGTPYFVHLMDVAAHVMQVTLDTEVIQAAYLHDVIEDTDTLEIEIAERFGDRVASIVKQLTLPKGVDGDYEKLEIQLKAVSVMGPEALIIKTMDKLSNVTALQFSTFSSSRRVLYAVHARQLLAAIQRRVYYHLADRMTPRGSSFFLITIKDVRDLVEKMYSNYVEVDEMG
jgi:guanosine-3',5'-bis(diphosphate) 3'-pyrophosphohydrolase